MQYRELGKTGLKVSEIGFGPEWMNGTPEETRELAEYLREAGVNLLDCWMADPLIRDNLGYAMRGRHRHCHGKQVCRPGRYARRGPRRRARPLPSARENRRGLH